MPNLQYGTTVVDRNRGDFTDIPVINMFVEEVPTEPNPSLQSRPGLQDTDIVMGDGPVRALYKVDGVLNHDLFGISGGYLYSDNSQLGAVDGNGPASLSAYADRVFANAGANVWHWLGTFDQVPMPNDMLVTHLTVAASRLVVIEKDTGIIWWSDPLTEDIDGLAFATAEQSPDKMKHLLYVGDTLILFGSETTEFWPVSGNPDLPFSPLVGRTFPVGIRETGCASVWNGTFAWVTNRNQVCVTEPNTVVSSPSLEEKIANSTGVSLWTFQLEGVEFLAVRTDDQTWVMNPRSSQWSTFESYGENNWIPQCYAAGVFGSSIDGRIVEWSEGHADFDNELERRFRAGLPIDSKSIPVHNLSLRANFGTTPFITGDYSEPVVELRTSKDGGHSWTDWKQKSLGATGHYRPLVRFLSLGFFGYPSFLAEFRVVDPVPFRVSNVTANEPYGTV